MVCLMWQPTIKGQGLLKIFVHKKLIIMRFT